ncbi:hypothetical protein EGW08_008660 [Elysia chlorotica]|uniref:Protein kinase domain-containing protein n=1 Tax=Elysia chlorotica TaxID=188477 RepID=A0A3S1BA92_ELYCH|nr:hypothetical protein EGW08_008660 [Elysia chlorotica]
MDYRDGLNSLDKIFTLQDATYMPGNDVVCSKPVVDKPELKRPGSGEIPTPGSSRKTSEESTLSESSIDTEDSCINNGQKSIAFSSSQAMYYPTDNPESGRPYSSLNFIYSPDVSDISDAEDSEPPVKRINCGIKFPQYDLSDSGIKKALLQLYGSLPIVERKHVGEIPQSSTEVSESSDFSICDSGILTSQSNPENPIEGPAKSEISRDGATTSNVATTDQSTSGSTNQTCIEKSDFNTNQPGGISDLRVNHQDGNNNLNTNQQGGNNDLNANQQDGNIVPMEQDLEPSHVNGAAMIPLERQGSSDSEGQGSSDNQYVRSDSRKIKPDKRNSDRAHPYKFPFKCSNKPTRNTAGVLEYSDWNFPSLDPKSAALDVLELRKISYLGGPDKFDVMLCEQTQAAKKKFVLKFYPRNSERFLRENTAVQPIRHPNVATPSSFRSLPNISFTVTNYFPRGSLARYIGELDICTIVRYFIKIANALAFLHAHNVVHRDLRPQNIMIDDDDNPMIADFDMADTLRPEVPNGRRRTKADINFALHYGTKTDAFSLGAVLHCMMFEVPYHEYYDFYDQASKAKMPDCTIMKLLK